jgi:ribosome biogenesis GTPase A
MKQVQWFPGHMAKARRLVEEKLPVIDIVFELLDARAPIASANPMLKEIIKKKPRLIILNKADLADPNRTRGWQEHFDKLGIKAIQTNALTDNLLPEMKEAVQVILAEKIAKEKTKGMRPRPMRVMVVGIPNVGKSQFINRLCGTNKTRTGDKPGITTAQQYVRIGDDFEILDNPGILWPKFDDPLVGMRLALLGSIKDDLLPLEEIVYFGLDFLAKQYPKRLEERYDLTNVATMTPAELIEAIGRRRGALQGGDVVDEERVIKLFLHDFRNEKFGRISLETIHKNV